MKAPRDLTPQLRRSARPAHDMLECWLESVQVDAGEILNRGGLENPNPDQLLDAAGIDRGMGRPEPAHATERVREAARLLLGVRWLRGAIADGWIELALVRAIELGVLAERSNLAPHVAMGTTYSKMQQERSTLGRGGPEMMARNEQIMRWNRELLDAAPDKRPSRGRRADTIHRRCQQTYRDKFAEASYHKSEDDKRAAKVWKIGKDRIEKLIPLDRKSS